MALDWLHAVCFREQTREDFFAKTLADGRERQTRITFDPPFLAGDALEIDARRAALRDLELTTDRLDLLAALLEAMTRHHRDAVRELGSVEGRVILTGERPDLMRRLLPELQAANIEVLEDGPLRGVARLFESDHSSVVPSNNPR